MGSFADVDAAKGRKKSFEKKKKIERENEIDGLVSTQHVILNDFDNNSYQLFEALVPLLDKPDVKAIVLWAEKAVELYKASTSEVRLFPLQNYFD